MKTKLFQGFLPLFIISVTTTSCFEPPEFSDEPEISFNSIEFVPVETRRDSLILTFNFRDGDGDIGLDNTFTLFPYHAFLDKIVSL